MPPLSLVVVAYLAVHWSEFAPYMIDDPPMGHVLYSIVEDRAAMARIGALPPDKSTLNDWLAKGWRFDDRDIFTQSVHHEDILVRLVHDSPIPGTPEPGGKK